MKENNQGIYGGELPRMGYNFDNPVQAIAQCGARTATTTPELRRSSTPYGVVGRGGESSTPHCAPLVRGYRNLTPSGVTLDGQDEQSPYSPKFVAKIMESEKQYQNGEYEVVDVANFWDR